MPLLNSTPLAVSYLPSPAAMDREFAFPVAGSGRSVPVAKKWPVCDSEQTLRANEATDHIGRRSAADHSQAAAGRPKRSSNDVSDGDG